MSIVRQILCKRDQLYRLVDDGFQKFELDPSPYVCGQADAKGVILWFKYAKIEKAKAQLKDEGHIMEDKFYNEKVQHAMDFLGLGEYEVREFNKVFRNIDVDGSGSISANEMFDYLKEKPSPLSDALFTTLDQSPGDGEMTFAEFFHFVCTLCMFGKTELLRFW